LPPVALYQSNLTWLSTGDGTFLPNANTLFAKYVPGPADVGTTVMLTLDLSGCNSLTDNDVMYLTVHPDPTVTISGSTSICAGVSTPVSISFTGTPPWEVTYTDGTVPVTVSGIMTTPYVFQVSPAVMTTWSVVSASDQYCDVPADSVFGVASIGVNPLPDPFTVLGSNGGYYCEGDTGVTLKLSSSETVMMYQLLLNGLPDGPAVAGTGGELTLGVRSTPGLYTVRGTNPAGNCQRMMNGTVTVVMNPTPVTDFTFTTACHGDTTYFTSSGNYISRISNWLWDFGDGTFATFNAPGDPSHVYPTYGSYTVTLMVEDTNNCTYSISHPVEVRPHPTAFFSISTPNCLGSATHFTDLSQNPTTGSQGYLNQWVWSYGDGTPNDTILFPSTANPTHTYAQAGTYLVTLFITNSRGCSDSYSAQVTVTNRPTAGFNFWSNCQQQTAYFQDATLLNGGGDITGWLWDFGDPASGAMNNSTQANPQHVYSQGGVYTVQLVVTNFNGCVDTVTRTVNVKMAPAAEFTHASGCLGSATQCWADTTLINLNATATYLWDFGDGSTANQYTTSHTYLASGSYTVTLTITDTAGCQGHISHDVTVTPPPVALFSSASDNCQGQGVLFTNQSTTTTGYLTQWVWNFGDGSPEQTILFPAVPDVTHSYAVTGSFNVTLTVTSSQGCTQWYTRTVNVHGAPTADFYSTGHCQGQAVQFTDLTGVSGNQSLQGWAWDFGDPASGSSNTSTDQDPEHTYAAAGTYTVRLVAATANGCRDTITHTVTITTLPVTDFTVASACQGNEAQFTPQGMATGTIASWHWDFGDGQISTQPSPGHTYAFAGDYTAVLTVTDTAGCSNTRSHPVTIQALPVVNFDFSTPGCDGQQVSFTDQSTTAGGYIAVWQWDFGDGTTQTVTFPAAAAVSHTYAQAGTFQVTLTVKTADSCTSQQVKVLTVMPRPTAAFSSGAACQGTAVSFTDASQSNTTSGVQGWHWDFGDPGSGTANQSTQQNPTHIYNTSGTYTVELIAMLAGGCSDTVTRTLTVSAPPAADFSVAAGCSGDSTLFTSSTLVNMAAIQGWYWMFGDGLTSTLADPLHIYSLAGTYTVTLTVTDTAGCTGSATQTVVVIPGPLSNFSFSTPACNQMPVTFTDLSNGNGGTITQWYWDFGDGGDTTLTSYAPVLTHSYAQAGTFNVTLTLQTQQGCTGLYQQVVYISPSPLSAFSYVNSCQGQATQFTDQSTLNGGSILVSYGWDFGDPGSGSANSSTQQNPVHSYASPGTYTVVLVTTNASGCQDTVSEQVMIHAKPGVDFYNDSLVCLGSAITFYTDTVATLTGAVQQYNWNFGDGTAGSTQQNPMHTYQNAGSYLVTLSISDTLGCQNVAGHTVTIHPAPQSSFSYEQVCAGSATVFTDLSLAPAGDTITAWYWDFGLAGSTDTSTQQHPQYTYLSGGTYTVTLTTTTEHGCSHSKSLPLQVWNTPTAYFSYTASPCANGAVQMHDSSWSYQATVQSWLWEFEPYQYGTGQNPSHVYYAIDSCYDVRLIVTDIRGCVDTTVQQVCVPPQLTVAYTYQQACFGDQTLFTPQLLTPAAPADSLITFSWNFGDTQSGAQNNSTLKTPGHRFTAPGFYTVSLTTTDLYGCQASDYQSVQVYALPVAAFGSAPGSCDSTVTFTSLSADTSAAIQLMYWDFGDGSLDTISAPLTTVTHKYTTAGTYTVTLTVENDNGCRSVVSDTVRRSPCLVAAYLSSDSLHCQNYALQFTDLSTCDGQISTWRWDWGDSTVTTVYTAYQGVTTHTYTQAGTYRVKLWGSTQGGGSTGSDSGTRQVTVLPSPLAGFSTQDVCYGQPMLFSDTTLPNGATLLRYRWDFSDPQTTADTSVVRNPQWTYPAPGSYSPQLVVTNQWGCLDTASAQVTIWGLPYAGFNHSLSCMGHPTYFFDQSDPWLAPLNLWGWRVSDSAGQLLGSMQGSLPQYTFTQLGRYQVLMSVSDTNGCLDTLRSWVQVQPSPLSAFSYEQNVDNTQGQLQFTDGSLGGHGIPLGLRKRRAVHGALAHGDLPAGRHLPYHAGDPERTGMLRHHLHGVPADVQGTVGAQCLCTHRAGAADTPVEARGGEPGHLPLPGV